MSEQADLRVKHGPRRCAFCHDDVVPEERVACASCLGAHHRACWEEAGSCATCEATEPLVRELEGPVRLAERAAAPGDPVETLGQLFTSLGYAPMQTPLEHTTIYAKKRDAAINIAGEGFKDCWVVIAPEANGARASRAAIDHIANETFQNVLHSFLREAVINLIVLGDDPSGLPAPSKTRPLSAPLIYTVTSHDPKTGETDIRTNWAGSVSAQRVLVGVRYALEHGVVPKEGGLISEGLTDSPGVRLGRKLLVFGLVLALMVALIGLLFELLKLF